MTSLLTAVGLYPIVAGVLLALLIKPIRRRLGEA